MGLNEVSNVLWRQRELLELLQFKLEEEQLLIEAGRNQWLTHATREVEVVLTEIRHAETVRAVAVDELAAELGLGANPSLREIAEAVPEQWREVFEGHRTAFLQATHQIHEVAKSNRDILTVNQQAAAEALATLEDDLQTYDPSGKPASRKSDHTRTFLVDEAL